MRRLSPICWTMADIGWSRNQVSKRYSVQCTCSASRNDSYSTIIVTKKVCYRINLHNIIFHLMSILFVWIVFWSIRKRNSSDFFKSPLDNCGLMSRLLKVRSCSECFTSMDSVTKHYTFWLKNNCVWHWSVTWHYQQCVRCQKFQPEPKNSWCPKL